MIVDDELNIRRGMEKSIPWQDWGFEVVQTASNGAEALEKIKHDKPDVVLSDIRMPQMDGVELMQHLNKNYPDIKIIILSGYSDFEYLNVSIKSNVTEYLLKPTDVDEFEEVFARVRSKIDEERQKEREFEKSKDSYLDNLLSTLLRGYEDEAVQSDDEEFLKNHCISTGNCSVVLFYLEWGLGDVSDKEVYETKKKILTFFNEYLKISEISGRVFLDSHDKIVGLFSADDELKKESISLQVDDMVRLARDKFLILLYASVGNRCTDRRMIAQSYEQAVCIAHQKTFHDGEYVAFYNIETSQNTAYKAAIFPCERIVNYIMKDQHKEAFDEINEVFNIFEQTQVDDYKYIEQACMEFLFYLSRWAMGHNINFEQIMDECGVRYEDVRNIVSLNKRKELIVRVVDALYECVSLSMHQSGKNNNLAQIVKECVDEEYMSNFMSLEYVAGKVKKSSAYISKLFKDEFGCNFSEYITRRRLEKSKELLQDPSKKIYEIAQMTGYADVSNFIKVFRKKFGISPGDYRNVNGRRV